MFWLDVVASPALLPQGNGDLNEAKEPYGIRRSGGMGIATDNAEHDVMLHRATLSFVTCRGGGVNTHGPKGRILAASATSSLSSPSSPFFVKWKVGTTEAVGRLVGDISRLPLSSSSESQDPVDKNTAQAVRSWSIFFLVHYDLDDIQPCPAQLIEWSHAVELLRLVVVVVVVVVLLLRWCPDNAKSSTKMSIYSNCKNGFQSFRWIGATAISS